MLLNSAYKEREKAYLEIMDYLTYILEITNPFDLMWLTSYELPTFILNRVKRIYYLTDSETDLVLNHIIQWCTMVGYYNDDKYTKLFFDYNLKELMHI